ncbi:MAG: gamma-glutamyl-gamma-aminobutyrate hydrolase family protein [Stappiaceae bacterium]
MASSSPKNRESSPVALVSADVKNVDGYVWHAAPASYLNALIEGSGALPLILPSRSPDIDIRSAIERVDGVLLTGSRSNVLPERYGEVSTEKNGPYDPERDATTFALAQIAIERGVPLLAICRGMQELNVALGGTLHTEIQERDDRFDHRAPQSDDNDYRFRLTHDIYPVPDGALSSILGPDPVSVNSLHRQSVGELADTLIVEARAEDGTIEAARVKDACGFTLATQWHPEYWVPSDKPSRAIFEAFGAAMRKYRDEKNTAE